ncbi:hypothetical protein Tco_0483855 [Tanacetum coccineum]
MIQYLKNMAGYAQLKDKSFDEVQKLFENHMKWINCFVPMEEVLPSEKDKQEQESSKRQRVEDDKEEEELKKCFELAKEEEITINVIPLATKVPVVGFQIHTRGKPGYYEIFRADGSSKLYHVFSQLLSNFDREDLVNLWKLVKANHVDNRPEEDFERVLWGDLRVMFEPDGKIVGIKRLLEVTTAQHDIFSKRPPSFHHVIKLDSTLGNLKFVNKGSKEPIFGMAILAVMLNDDIKASAKYSEYLAKSKRVTLVKSGGKVYLPSKGLKIAVERSSDPDLNGQDIRI